MKRISDFLLAGGKLRTPAIVSLLLSSSFGLNAIFYGAWLGYSIGIWALIIQCAWSISFFLLIPASRHFTRVASLHDFLGRRFGTKSKLLASLCSLVGIMYFVVWEVNINIDTITPLLSNASIIIGFFAFLTISYTVVFGLRGNAFIDTYINLTKILILLVMSTFAIGHLFSLPTGTVYQSIFPSFDRVIINLGIMGFITNIVFNIAWQFVDNSSWQTIIAGAKRSHESTVQNLKYSGLLIFLTVNLLSTLIGISLAHQSNVTPDNILSMTSGFMPHYSLLLTTGIIVLSITSMMSLVDGMLLTSALTINLDIIPKKFLTEFDEKKKMRLIQLSIIVVGLVSIWGIELILKAFHANLFDLLYIIVISQLSLIGPVVIGLYTNGKKNRSMWFAIMLALIVGFGSIAVGTITGSKQLIDGAGTFCVITSLIVAWIIRQVYSRYRLG